MKRIFLVHGLLMGRPEMKVLAVRFKKLGYQVHSFGYSTLFFDNHGTIEKFKKFVDNKTKLDDEVYFLGHSMGGLLIRLYFQKYKPVFKNTRIVTLCSPHKGSAFAKQLPPLLKVCLIKAGKSGFLNKIESWHGEHELGCIAGNVNRGIGFNYMKNKAQGDGTVFVKEAILDNCTDHIILDISHTGSLYSKESVKQSHHFFQNGYFEKNSK